MTTLWRRLIRWLERLPALDGDGGETDAFDVVEEMTK
jgi:hypothetical protein